MKHEVGNMKIFFQVRQYPSDRCFLSSRPCKNLLSCAICDDS